VGRKRNLIEALGRYGILTCLPTLPRLTVLAYHRVRASVRSAETYPFDDSVFGPDENEFDAQMRWLSWHADPIGEGDLIAALEGKAKLPKRAVLVTFDDGYKDNHELALPVLKKYGVPAIFFIAPALIDQRRLGFWDHAAWANKLAGGSAAEFRALANELKTTYGQDPETALSELRRRLNLAAPSAELENKELMTWEQIQDLQRQGMAVGSHGLTHRVLARLTPAEQWHELMESKVRLEQRLDAPVRTVAFPAGSPGAYTAETQELAGKCGYAACFTYETGVNDPAELVAHDIRRVPAGPSVALAACAVKAPWLLGKAFYG
jgi:peptidoglycan/xylan/chitin deacetylase (PgdA/CDA1 family)